MPRRSVRKPKAAPENPTLRGPELTPFGNGGLDTILTGGLPRGRVMLAVGNAGCGKTVFGLQFLVRGILDHNEPGVLVSFEESVDDLTANAAGFGWDLKALLADKRLAVSFMDLSSAQMAEAGHYDLSGMFLRIEMLIKRVGAKRIVIDGINNLLAAFENEELIRTELLRLFRWLKDQGLTVFATGERGDKGWTRLGFEEYLADGLMVLQSVVEGKIAKRTLRVVKCRGIGHADGEYPFLIDRHGPKVFPIDAINLDYPVKRERISTGVDGLDHMLGEKGVFRGSVILVGGMAGTGKTTLGASFCDSACNRGEKALFFTLEEVSAQIRRNMRSIGLDLGRWEKEGQLEIRGMRALQANTEDHLTAMQQAVRDFEPSVVVIDPISSMSAIAGELEIRSLLTRLMDFLRSQGITTMLTNLGTQRDNDLAGGLAISSIADTWVVVRSIESHHERNNVVQVLKSRGMEHSREMREFLFTRKGLQFVPPHIGVDGVYLGSARELARARDAQARIERETEVEKQLVALQERRAALSSEIEAMEAQFAAEEAAVKAQWESLKKSTAVADNVAEQLEKSR